MRGLRWFCGAAAALAIGLSAPQAFAYDWVITAHVTLVEPTYIPAGLDFTVDTTAGSCTAGSALWWTIQGADESSKIANAQAVLSTLMTAMVAQRTVQIFRSNTNGASG